MEMSREKKGLGQDRVKEPMQQESLKKVIDPHIVTKQTESDQQKIISAAMEAFNFSNTSKNDKVETSKALPITRKEESGCPIKTGKADE